MAVWEVRGIIDCYNWCPLISWQHCRLPRGWHVSACVCLCEMAVEWGCDKHTLVRGISIQESAQCFSGEVIGKKPG